MVRKHPRIAIIGGGIGGLTLALALRQRGLRAEVYEQAQVLAEIGAAVALSANATRELDRLGLMPALSAVSAEPTELIYRDWRDGRRIAAHPVREGGAYRARFGAPYFGIHRADLQKVLSGALACDGEGLDGPPADCRASKPWIQPKSSGKHAMRRSRSAKPGPSGRCSSALVIQELRWILRVRARRSAS